MAKNNQRDPNLRTATVARVNQLVKGGLTKAGAFEKISAETGRTKDAVQMLYYRAVRAGQKGTQAPPASPASRTAPRRTASRRSRSRRRKVMAQAAKPTAPVVAPKAGSVPASRPAPARRRRSRRAARRSSAGSRGVAQSGEFPGLLNGIASAINALLKHVEKTVQENKTLKQQSQRLQAITSLIRGR